MSGRTNLKASMVNRRYLWKMGSQMIFLNFLDIFIFSHFPTVKIHYLEKKERQKKNKKTTQWPLTLATMALHQLDSPRDPDPTG